MSALVTWKHKFSTSLSCQRVRSVQNLLKKNESSQLQCILAVLGVDGRFNEGCREFANYLTCGFFTLRQNELEKAGIEEEDVEDVILLIRSQSVSLYCGAMLYDYLLPYVAHWKNLQIFCKTQDSKDVMRDTDVEETFKVRSFISMLKGCNNIGIPYIGSSTTQTEKTSSPFSIEKWPLIQSYASEDIGIGKFFSVDNSVIDIRPLLLPLYSSCDPFVVEKIVSGAYPLFLRHWNEALSVVKNAVKSKTILQLKEDQVLEPLQSYYKHGQLSKFGKREKTTSKPFVRFGIHSLDLEKDTKYINFKAGAKKGAVMPNHLVIRCVAPSSPLSCSRTYFFKQQGKPDDKEFDNLISLYLSCVEGASIAINEFTNTLNRTKAEKKVVEHLLCKGVSGGLVFDAKCKIIACDKLGKKMEDESASSVYVVEVLAENIKASHGGEAMGSVIFSDTFIVSSFEIFDGECDSIPTEKSTSCHVLTSDIPSYYEWQTESGKAESKLGEYESLAFCRDLTVCSNSVLYSPPSNMNVQFNQDGKILLNADNIEEIILKNGVQYYDSPSPGKVCLLVINFDLPENSVLWGRVPVHYRGEVNIIPDVDLLQASRCVVLALMPRSPAYKVFYADVMHGTMSGLPGSINLKQIKELSPDLLKMYDSIQNVWDKRLGVTKSTFAKSDLQQNHTSISDLMKHLSLSSIASDSQVPNRIVTSVLQKISKTDVKNSNQNTEKICVTVIAGLPCSGAEDISQQLISLNKEKVRWVVIKPTASSMSDCTIVKENLEDQLSQLATHRRVARPSAAARKNLRIIVLAVGFFDLCEIVQCITHHSDIAVRGQLLIGAVTTCVTPNSVYYSDRQNYPKFFSGCLPGIVNNFAFVVPEHDTLADDVLARVQSFFRCINKQAAFLTCPGGKLIRKSDFELVLSEDNFSSMKMTHERFLLRPDMCVGKYESGNCHPSVSKVLLEFSQPLLRGTFCARLRGFKSSLLKPQQVGGVCFVNGCVAFTDDPKQAYDISFASVTETVELTPRSAQAVLPKPPSKGDAAKPKPYVLEFNGIALNEEALKDWLRKCGRQKPSKKSHKTKNKLTKNEMQMIHEENCTRHLPEGYFFNGSFYVSLFNNEKMVHHPNMKKFVDEYLNEENQEIDAYNADIDRQNIKDVFDV